MTAGSNDRREMYDAGLSDREIADRQGVHRTSILTWRVRNGLPAKRPARGIPGEVRVVPTIEAARLAWHAEGLTDHEIGAREGISHHTICGWRNRRGLPAHQLPARTYRADPRLALITSDLKRRCLSLLERGIGARLICREMNVARSTVNGWRSDMLRARPELRRPGTAPRRVLRFPSGRAYSLLRPERRARAFLLYADGLNDHEIAAELGLYQHQIWQWRNALYLPVIGRRYEPARPTPRPAGPAITPMSNPIHAHIVRSMGRGLAPDIIDDAVSDVWLAIAEGRITIEQIASVAGSYRNKAAASYASSFGPRSLDENIGNGDGFCMIDLIRDDRSSSWLEEMGATVW